jgi:acyl-lipid Delta6-acetylenase / acyl-lipid (9-3)-desaturase
MPHALTASATGDAFGMAAGDHAAPLEAMTGASRRLSWNDVAQHCAKEDAWIAIRGRVYDVTAFAAEHPGGDILFTAAGGDATDVFAGFHASTDSWKMLPQLCVGVIDSALAPSPLRKVDAAYLADVVQMRREMQKLGMFKSSKAYYVYKVLSNVAMLSTSVATLVSFPGSWPALLLSSLVMGLFWQQCGWLAHDFLHHQVFLNRAYNNLLGVLIGNVFQGFSVAWWKNKHNHHHAVPNVTDSPSGGDPDIQTMPVLWWSEKLIEGDDIESLPRFLLKNQAILYWPILCMARTSWVLQSILHQLLPRNKHVTSDAMYVTELVGLAIHHLSYLYLLTFIPSVAQLALFVVLTQGLGGLLIGVVFTVGHNAMEVLTPEEMKATHFVSMQVRTTRNVTPNWFNNWFTGGLGYQVEHHIWPTLPRHSLPHAAVILQKFCHDHNVPYTCKGLVEGNAEVWRLLAAIGVNAA